MIVLAKETVVSFAEAAGFFPRRRQGKKPNIATLYRWSTNGCRGVVLETCQVGGTRCTSIEAIQRFVDALSLPGGQPVRRASSLTAHAAAERELDRENL